MKTSTAADERRRKIGGACLLAAPLLLLAGDLMRAGAGLRYESLIVMKLSFAFFVAAVLALVHLLRDGADRTGLAGGALAIVGCLAGSGIVTAAMIRLSLETASLGEPTLRAVEDAMQQSGVPTFVYLFPLSGLAFSAGLLVLSVGLLRSGVVPAPSAVLLAVGALLFPSGRIPGIEPAVLASSVALAASMGWIGWRILKRAAPSREQTRTAGTLGDELPALRSAVAEKPF
jgi:hypothetical protein